ncbi:hypothetical protein [Bacillus alkalicellulosilyticus]|uniref:hypothetical protein n=1 Tax=Alkalihalobacterium alkalicellulosilyticum TaxID=1912214 RepID=UPI00099679F9|nr:hypothetical protein [Bacillus alkalicellulosilyticus]
MKDTEDILKQADVNNEALKKLIVQRTSSGNNEAKTVVDNMFKPINISSSSAVSTVVSSYLTMFSVLLQNESFLEKHEEYVLEKINQYEEMMLQIIKDEERYKEKTLNLLNQ